MVKTIFIENDIVIPLDYMSDYRREELFELMNKYAKFPNQKYLDEVKYSRLGKSSRPKDIKYYKTSYDEDIGNYMSISYGLLTIPQIENFLIDLIDREDYKLADFTSNSKSRTFEINKKTFQPLKETQIAVLDALGDKRMGTIQAVTGFGKTRVMTEIIKEKGLKTLILTHKADLPRQYVDSLKRNYILEDSDIAYYTKGECIVPENHSVAIGTIVTALKHIDTIEEEDYGLLFIDESHNAGGNDINVTMYKKVLDRIRAKYRLGLTATPKENTMLIGNVIVDAEKVALKEDIEIDNVLDFNYRIIRNSKPLDKVKQLTKYNYKTKKNEDICNFNALRSVVANDDYRNEFIADNAINMVEQMGRRVCIITELKSHARNLYNTIKAKYEGVSEVSGDVKEEKRAEIFKKINESPYIMIANDSIISEGIDIPNLDTLIFATQIKSEKQIIQAVGRIRRATKDKKTPMVFYIRDNMIDSEANEQKWLYSAEKRFVNVITKLQNSAKIQPKRKFIEQVKDGGLFSRLSNNKNNNRNNNNSSANEEIEQLNIFDYER